MIPRQLRECSLQASEQARPFFVYTSSVHISLSFPTPSHRQIFFSHLPKIACIGKSLPPSTTPSSTTKKEESPGSSFRADPQCTHVEKMLASIHSQDRPLVSRQENQRKSTRRPEDFDIQAVTIPNSAHQFFAGGLCASPHFRNSVSDSSASKSFDKSR